MSPTSRAAAPGSSGPHAAAWVLFDLPHIANSPIHKLDLPCRWTRCDVMMGWGDEDRWLAALGSWEAKLLVDCISMDSATGRDQDGTELWFVKVPNALDWPRLVEWMRTSL